MRRSREGRITWIGIEPAARGLIPSIHEPWDDLYLRYCAELGESQAETLNQLVSTTIKGGRE